MQSLRLTDWTRKHSQSHTRVLPSQPINLSQREREGLEGEAAAFIHCGNQTCVLYMRPAICIYSAAVKPTNPERSLFIHYASLFAPQGLRRTHTELHFHVERARVRCATPILQRSAALCLDLWESYGKNTTLVLQFLHVGCAGSN